MTKYHNFDFKNRPLKAVTFNNASYLSYVNLLARLKMNYNKNEPSINMLLRHLREVVNDNPKNLIILRDTFEVLYKILHPKNFKNILVFIFNKLFSIEVFTSKKRLIANVDSIKDIDVLINSRF